MQVKKIDIKTTLKPDTNNFPIHRGSLQIPKDTAKD
jgi:hypothetical protein